MIKVNVAEAKAKLSKYLEAVSRGEHVVICKRNEPIAELRAIEQKRKEPRPVGLGRGTAKILPSFWDPMPDEFLDAIYKAPPFPEPAGQPATKKRGSRRS